MKYLSVCSGVEAATVAWHSLGWEAEAFSEIEKFPSKVLAHHYPHVPNLGDMTKFEEWNIESIDLLVGGTPCQSFSVAGLRKGLSDPRGNLMLTFGAIANRFRPRWLVWENVPGVLSSNGGRDFGTFLGMLAVLGYGFAYRILDAQYAGLAQRRKRVFIIGSLGNGRSAEILFERDSVQGDTLSEDTEILADFSVLKRILESKLDVLDHRFINEVPPFDRINPSAENLARYLWGELEPEIKKLGVKLVSVSVSEKDTQTATYREVDDGERHA